MEISVDIRESFRRFKKLITSPKEFLKTTAKEKDWKKAFSFLVVVAGFGHLFTALYNVLINPSGVSEVAGELGLGGASYGATQVIMAVFVGYFFALAISFLWGFLLKLLLSVFKIESSFAQAYKVVVYARAPAYAFGWLPFVNLFASFYSLYLMVLSLESEYSVKRKKAVTIIVSIVVIIFVFSLLAFSLAPSF